MSDFNSTHNRVVWCDIPVADLERACTFYRGVLGVGVDIMEFNGSAFALFAHSEGNGGCLIPHPDYAGCADGPLVYLNTDGRIRDAVAQAIANGGRVIEDVHPIGPHGFRALVFDSEGTRLALHSSVDA